EERRRVEEAAAVERRPADHDAGPGVDGALHLLVQSVADAGARRWPELGGVVQRVADSYGAQPRRESPLELLGDRPRDDEPLGGDARLAVVDQPRLDAGLDRRVEVGARHHDEWIAAAELEHDLLEMASGLARD